MVLCGMPAAGAAEMDDRLFTRVDAYGRDARIEIVVGLTGPYRYVSHALDSSGTLLQVRLRYEPAAGTDVAPSDGIGSLRWAGPADVPLEQLNSDPSGSLPSAILRFAVPVQVLAVGTSLDDRTMTVSIARPAAQPVPRGAGAASAVASAGRTGIFVVNLTSTTAETPIEGDLAASLAAGEHVYQMRARSHDALRYRQRLGFFDSAAAAQARLQQLGGAYPDAWVGEITDVERNAVLAGSRLIDHAKIIVRSDATPAAPEVSLERLTELTDEAKAAAAAGELTRAGTIYERIAAYPVSPFRQDARELLGVVREKAGQIALAKAAYEAYLRDYADSAGAVRVKQRLQALVAPPARMSARIESTKPRPEGAAWDLFGSLYQFYRYDQFQINDESARTTRSLLSTDLDGNARRRSDALDLRMRLTGSYDHDFLDSTESEFRAAMAYVDLATRDQVHSARLGRQTRTSGGALGRFDGAYYGHRFSERYRINAIAGAPVASTADSIDTDRTLYGASLDFGPYAQNWSLTLYGVQQTVEGTTDRQAAGVELRYLSPALSMFGLADYDVYFSEPNILYVIGSGNLGDSTTLSVIADRRRSPLLSTSNALIGQTARTIGELQATFSEEQIKALALDRTAISSSYTVSLSQAIDQRFRVSGDVTSTRTGDTPASGGVEAIPGSGPDWYYNLQLIGTSLFADSDLSIVGLRYVDATSYSGVAGLLNYRWRSPRRVDLNPRIRIERRSRDDGRVQWVYAPGLRALWSPARAWALELELAAELSDQQLGELSDKSKLYFAYVGYRYDF